jgi:NDP-sugar pyrophosphorylase family protein
MPINGELPILEIVLRQLRKSGFSHVTLAVGHLSEIIRAFFGNGEKWGLKVDYSLEEKPLSTIGPLTLIKDLPEQFLVMNGDVLTDIDFRSLMDCHIDSGAMVTVAVSRRRVKIDYGVVQYNEGKIIGFREKPVYEIDVSMGVYVISRRLVNGLKPGMPYGFDNLMLDGIHGGADMRVYPYDGYWLDIGRPDDFDQANEQFPSMRNRFLAE